MEAAAGAALTWIKINRAERLCGEIRRPDAKALTMIVTYFEADGCETTG